MCITKYVTKILELQRTKRIELIKEKLTKRGYYITPKYGLILKKECDEEVIAEIRSCEENVVIPYSNLNLETEPILSLIKTLIEDEINFRTHKTLFTYSCTRNLNSSF